MCSSPRLFAAYHVFHRLPVPGHPPCALLCLTSLYHPRSPSGSQGRSKNGSYTPPQANLRRVFLCSLVLLAIAFSIYIRVIDSNFFYQRRGLMFDVSDLIFRSNLSLIQFSRYEKCLTRNCQAGRSDQSGDGEIRTHDPLLARQVLSQLSYTPTQHLLLKSFCRLRQKENGLKWTRTTDLTLIRRAL